MNQPTGNLTKGILAGAAGTGSLVTLYTGGKRGAEDLVLYVANIAATAKTFRVQVVNAAATVTTYLAYDVSVAPNSLPIELDIPCLRQGDLVKFLGSDANVYGTLFGSGSE